MAIQRQQGLLANSSILGSDNVSKILNKNQLTLTHNPRKLESSYCLSSRLTHTLQEARHLFYGILWERPNASSNVNCEILEIPPSRYALLSQRSQIQET